MEQRKAKKLAKQKRRAFLKSALALLLVLLFVVMAISPIIFAETVTIPVSNTSSTEADYTSYLEFMMDMVENNYYKEVDRDDLIEGMYKGVFDVLDPYSTYFTPEEYSEFNTSIEGEFYGIGASITLGQSGYVEVVAPLKGTPAEKAGLMPGDKIVSINGEDAEGFTTEKAVTLIRGPLGTDVTLGILRQGHTDAFEVTITRGLIVLKSVEYEVLEEGIGYIQLTDFNDKTNSEFDKAMAYMVNNDIEKVIVDVRNNPGGLLNVAIYVSDYFVAPGKEIVTIDYRGATDRTYRATREKAPVEVAVLVNGGSASASEIFAGSIQQTGAGIVVGDNTYGKGTVQSLYPLNTGGGIKITIAEYLLSDGYKVDTVGVKPDIEVSNRMTVDVSQLVPFNLKKGTASINVYALQERLQLLGYKLEADGGFGPVTRETLRQFQKDYQIPVTGTIDGKTVETLDAALMGQLGVAVDLQLQKAIEALN
ncbi:S41 family peptidase [Fusibacter tunisiensis]|uniref:Carboxyl-terminal processing protease n=1 Tax=Fusibacter tunisiensis TaxID=1008308 RepID=A0ABS2MNF1_9FIRM|nr:S41 family peptidase [Fusibacter tunisiensis]MBM7560920.1 carboxyl-terminal processing protease [Fusibacter tunisiensis]